MYLGWFDMCLNVGDLQRSKRFYEALGLSVVDGNESDGYVVMANADARIALYQGHIEENLMNFRGGDVRAIHRSLKEKGVRFDQDAVQERDGSMSARLRDPDGNLIYFNTFPGETKKT